MSKSRHKELTMLQGPEWNSSDDDDDDNDDLDDKGLATTSKAVLKKGTKHKSVEKGSKRSKKGKMRDPILDRDDDDNNDYDKSVVYVGHLPKEFEERDLKVFLGQFGKVERCRLSRSIKTGNPRGFGFAKFTDAEVAKIVAETLQGYFVGNRRLVCHIVAEVKPGTFFDTDKAIERRKLRNEKQKKQRQRNLSSASKLKEITSRLIKREESKRAKFAELGIDYEFPGYHASNMIAEEDEGNGEAEVIVTPSAKSGDNRRGDGEESNEKKSKKKKRKDSVDSILSSSSSKQGSSNYKNNNASGGADNNIEGSKRKDSISSETSETKGEKKKKKSKRKDSIDSLGSDGPSPSKRQRKDSISSETSDSKEKKKKKSRRKDSIDSFGSETSESKKMKKKSKRKDSIDSIGSEASESKKEKKKKSKRKDSIDSIGSEASESKKEKKEKKSKRKDSVDSIGSESSLSKKRDRKDSVSSESSLSKRRIGSAEPETPPVAVKQSAEVDERLVQSEKKKKKKKNKRRVSAP